MNNFNFGIYCFCMSLGRLSFVIQVVFIIDAVSKDNIWMFAMLPNS